MIAPSKLTDHNPINPRLIAPGSNEWPARLDELGPHEPPKKLFVSGREIHPQARAVAIVGTRRPTAAVVRHATPA